MMKSYSIQQKPCQFIAEGCSYQLQRYKNNLKKQMILQENRKIDRNRLTVLRYNENRPTWTLIHISLFSSLPPISFIRFYHKWCISKSFLGHFQALAIKLSNLNLCIILDVFTFIIACQNRKITEVICSPAYLVPLVRLTFLYQILIIDDTDIVICHNFPLP